MKIKITMKYRNTMVLTIISLLALAVLWCISILGIINSNYTFMMFSIIFSLFVFVGLYFLYNYGLKITDKRIIAIEQSKMKILRYNDISKIIVKFTNENVEATIKTKKQKDYVFLWQQIISSARGITSLHTIIIKKEFVEKSIEDLSKCEKVQIQNFYTEN